MGVTFVELAIDFEIATGHKLNDPKCGNRTAWGRKGEMMKILFKNLKKMYPKYDAPLVTQNVWTLLPFGGRTPTVGLESRPKLMMGPATEVTVVENIINFWSNGPAGPGTGVSRGRGINHVVIYNRLGIAPIATDRDVSIFYLTAKEYRDSTRPRRRLRGKQKPRTPSQNHSAPCA